jgi:hypothetical protein
MAAICTSLYGGATSQYVGTCEAWEARGENGYESARPKTQAELTRERKDAIIHAKMRDDYERQEQTRELVAIVNPTNQRRTSSATQIEAADNLEKQIAFIKAALPNVDEKKINKIKVKELYRLVGKAEEEMTVGSLRKLFREKDPGFVKRALAGLGILR